MLTINDNAIFRDNALMGRIEPDHAGIWRFRPSGTQNISIADMTWLLTVLRARALGA